MAAAAAGSGAGAKPQDGKTNDFMKDPKHAGFLKQCKLLIDDTAELLRLAQDQLSPSSATFARDGMAHIMHHPSMLERVPIFEMMGQCKELLMQEQRARAALDHKKRLEPNPASAIPTTPKKLRIIGESEDDKSNDLYKLSPQELRDHHAPEVRRIMLENKRKREEREAASVTTVCTVTKTLCRECHKNMTTSCGMECYREHFCTTWCFVQSWVRKEMQRELAAFVEHDVLHDHRVAWAANAGHYTGHLNTWFRPMHNQAHMLVTADIPVGAMMRGREFRLTDFKTGPTPVSDREIADVAKQRHESRVAGATICRQCYGRGGHELSCEHSSECRDCGTYELPLCETCNNERAWHTCRFPEQPRCKC